MPRSRSKNAGLSRSLRENSRHSSVRGKPGSFLRPARVSRGRRAQRRSRAAAGRRSRLALDGAEHDGIDPSLSGRSDLANGAKAMDLVTLVTACALSVDPKLMHALVWHQSGGEPWAVSRAGRSEPARLPQHATRRSGKIRSSSIRRRCTYRSRRRFRVAVEGHSIRSPAMPQCRDGGRADHEADSPVQDTSASEEPIRRSVRLRFIAAPGSSRTSSSRPTSRHRLRRETRRISTCRRAPAPRFSTPPPIFRSTPGHSAVDATAAFADQARSWSSALFPAKVPSTSHTKPDDNRSDRPAVINRLEPVMPALTPTRSKPQDRDLFVRRSSNERSQ